VHAQEEPSPGIDKASLVTPKTVTGRHLITGPNPTAPYVIGKPGRFGRFDRQTWALHHPAPAKAC